MFESAKARFRGLVESELTRVGNRDRAALDGVFSKLDPSVERLIAGKGMDRAQADALRAALAEVKAEFHAALEAESLAADRTRRPPPELLRVRSEPHPAPAAQPLNPPARSLKRWIGGGLAAAGIVGALIVVPDIASALQTRPTKPQEHLLAFQARLDRSAKSVGAVTKYLQQVGKAVEARQKADPVALTALAGDDWISLKSFDAELFGKKPKGLPRKVEIKLRAVGDGYKVILRSPLCTDAKYLKPAFVDPKRDPKSAGCEYLAVWSGVGAKF